MRALVVCLILAQGFAGCAFLKEATTYRAGEDPAEMKAEADAYKLPMLPSEGKALVYVVRPSNIGFLVRFNVFVDNQAAASEVGHTVGNEYIMFEVSPGSHTIYSKAENWAEAAIAPKAGDVVFVRQYPNIGLLFARNSLAVVDEVEGKHALMKSSLGIIEKSAASDARPQAAPAGKAVGRSQWNLIPAGSRIKVLSKVGAYTGGFIAYHDGVLWIATDGGGKKALDALEIGSLQVLETRSSVPPQPQSE